MLPLRAAGFLWEPRACRDAGTTHTFRGSLSLQKEQSAEMWQRKLQGWQGSSVTWLLMALWCSVQHPSCPEPEQGGTENKPLRICSV